MASQQPPDQTDQDLALIVGGSFSPDHVGLAVYQQVSGRVRAAPDRYLQAFERRFVTGATDPLDLADLDLTSFLKLLLDRSPQQVRALGTRLADVLRRGVPSTPREDWEEVDDEGEPNEPTRKRRRLQQQLATLGTLGSQPP